MGAPETSAGGGARREAFATAPADPQAERERILALWRSGLAQNGDPEGKFDWYYRRNPESQPAVFLLRASGSEAPVGVASVGSRRMRLGDEDLETGALVDFVVVPEHRSFFPALFLQKEMRRHGLARHPVLFGLPNAQSQAIVGRAGYRRVGDMVRRVRVLRSAAYLSRHVPRPLAAAASAVIDRGRMAWAGWSVHRAGAYTLGSAERPDARFDALWRRAAHPGVMVGMRDSRFLAWRFVECPFGAFEFLTLEPRGARELAAYAVVQIREDTMHVLDFLVDPGRAAAGRSLWMELAREAWRRGLSALSVEFLGPWEVAAGMEAAGLVARERRSLYAAFEGRAGLDRPEAWYLTSADEDA